MYRVVPKGTRSRVAFDGNMEADDETLVSLTLPGKDFIFAQTSIVTSVMLEPQSWYIKPQTSMYVNANGDGWSNESLKANFETFIGAFNYVNHVQEPNRSAGFIADAALRRIILGDPDEKIFVFYVDILVATSRLKRRELCDLIMANKIQYLSMGCDMEVSQCSSCGQMCKDEMDLCNHLMNNKGKYFIDRQGFKRITCELLGSSTPGSCLFMEASWLTEPPASGAAVKRHILSVGDDQSVVVQMPKWAADREAVQMWGGSYRQS